MADTTSTRGGADNRIASAIDEITTRTGSMWGDPLPAEVRDIFAKHGLSIVLANPADAIDVPSARVQAMHGAMAAAINKGYNNG